MKNSLHLRRRFPGHCGRLSRAGTVVSLIDHTAGALTSLTFIHKVSNTKVPNSVMSDRNSSPIPEPNPETLDDTPSKDQGQAPAVESFKDIFSEYEQSHS